MAQERLDSEEIIRFITAIFENPALYTKTVTIGNLEVHFQLPTFNDSNELRQILTKKIQMKQITTNKELRHCHRIYKLAMLIRKIMLGGKMIYESTGALEDRFHIISNTLRTEPAFKMLMILTKQFEQAYKKLISEAADKDFFQSMSTFSA